jgi:hypothetical protein
VALWGFGGMNKIMLGYLQEKGYKVVAVIGHHDIGKDSGEVSGDNINGVKISHPSDADQVLKETRPQVAILATKSFLKDIAAPLRVLGQHKVNVITISEEAFYSWNTEPELTSEIDKIFRDNAVTFTGTGY